jgi:hypothetical protein
MPILLVQNTNTHNKRKKSIIIFLKAKQKEVALTYSNNIMFTLVKDNNILEL